jgi:endonuclease YncB( thermonuclease family)
MKEPTADISSVDVRNSDVTATTVDIRKKHPHPSKANGILQAIGTVALSQFWPDGSSDADTSHIRLTLDGGFTYNGKRTDVLNGAVVKQSVDQKEGQLAIANNDVTVRLEGIDASELHFRPTVQGLTPEQKSDLRRVNADFRQFFAESSTIALGNFLRSASPEGATVPCVLRTRVTRPGEIFDAYGRFIGELVITLGGAEVVVNRWLVEQGWAFPTIYSSMSPKEAEEILRLAESAQKTKRGLWGALTGNLQFDPELVFRSQGTPEPLRDRGPVLVPKVFRRLATWSVLHRARIFTGDFVAYLKAHPDACWHIGDFLPSKRRYLHEFISTQNAFTTGPGDLVFEERPSVLVDAAGKEIKSW